MTTNTRISRMGKTTRVLLCSLIMERLRKNGNSSMGFVEFIKKK
jgi:hypothetical protein